MGKIGTDMYHQKLGIAIGAKFAPLYANLFIAGLEWKKKFFSDVLINPLRWLQYLDDMFCMWPGDLDKLKELFIYLNSSHPTIKHTIHYSSTNINFVDVFITKNGTNLSTDLFTKDTHSREYLHVGSCSPPNCKKSIPYGQVIRIKRICCDDNWKRD